MSRSVPDPAGLRQRIKRGCASVYRHLHVPPRPGDVVMLNYHSIQPDEPYSTPPEMFAQQLKLLAEQFELSTLPAWFERRQDRTRDHRPVATVTFDDGYENVFQFAYPVLQRLQVPATIFVTTGFVTGGCGVESRLAMYRDLRPLQWAQVEELHRAGILIGSHTHRHLDLGRATAKEIAEELTHSRQLLEDHLGSPVTYFAYPWGQRRNIGRQTIPLLRECGYMAACSTLWGRNTAETPPYLLRRVRVDPWDTVEDFQAMIAGDWDFVGHYQRWR